MRNTSRWLTVRRNYWVNTRAEILVDMFPRTRFTNLRMTHPYAVMVPDLSGLARGGAEPPRRW
jgi:hypothetical protein